MIEEKLETGTIDIIENVIVAHHCVSLFRKSLLVEVDEVLSVIANQHNLEMSFCFHYNHRTGKRSTSVKHRGDALRTAVQIAENSIMYN